MNSVQATQLPLPPNPTLVIPELANMISCHQGFQGLTYRPEDYGVLEGFDIFSPSNVTELFGTRRSMQSLACWKSIRILVIGINELWFMKSTANIGF